jgi:type III secretion protein V
VAAGLFVTRVAGNDDEGDDLGAAISEQLTKQPRVFLVTAAMCLMMVAIPGFPKLAFVMLTLFFGGLGIFLMRRQLKTSMEALLSQRAEEEGQAAAEEDLLPPTKVQEFSAAIPILIDLSASARSQVAVEDLERDIDYARENLYFETGVMFPPAFVRFGVDIESGRYRIYVFEVPTAEGPLDLRRLYLDAPAEAATDIGVRVESGENVMHGRASLWVAPEDTGLLHAAGVPALGCQELVVRHFVETMRRQAHQFLGVQEVNFLISKMQSDYPDLIKEMLRVVPLQKVADIMRRLVQEGVSIRNLRDIFESLAEWGQREKDVVLLSEYARMGLKRYLSSKYAGAERTLAAVLIGQDVEEKFRQSIRVTNAGSYLALDTEVAAQILERLRSVLAAAGGPRVLLSSMDIRRYVRSLIENEFHAVPVLSYQELSPDVRIQATGQLTL